MRATGEIRKDINSQELCHYISEHLHPVSRLEIEDLCDETGVIDVGLTSLGCARTRPSWLPTDHILEATVCVTPRHPILAIGDNDSCFYR